MSLERRCFSEAGVTNRSALRLIRGLEQKEETMSWFKRGSKDDEPAQQSKQSDMSAMVSMLVLAPEEQRRQMLADRLVTFAERDEETRQVLMANMLDAALALPDDEYQKIAASRLAALNTLPEGTRMQLMMSHAAVVKSLPEDLRAKEMRTMQAVIADLPPEQGEMVKGMMKNLGLMG